MKTVKIGCPDDCHGLSANSVTYCNGCTCPDEMSLLISPRDPDPKGTENIFIEKKSKTEDKRHWKWSGFKKFKRKK